MNGWRIRPMSGGSGTISHPVIAIAPGCPDERHPTRDCACAVFRSRAEAEAHIAGQAPETPGAAVASGNRKEAP